jgi:antitoxin VapB
MALNIKNPEVEKLATEIAKMTGETKTEAIRKALKERQNRLAYQVVQTDRSQDLLQFLKEEIWSEIPKDQLEKRLTPEEEDAILGYGENGF